MGYHRVVVLIVVTLLASVTGLGTGPAPAGAQAQAPPPSGSFALAGEEARDFDVPADAVAVRSWTDARGRTVTRYQQMVAGASVLGGQITVAREADGTIVSAIGAYFPGLRPKNSASVGQARARGIVEQEIGRGGQWRSTLRLHPATASLFYEVQSLRSDSRASPRPRARCS